MMRPHMDGKPAGRGWRGLALSLGVVGLTSASFCCGRYCFPSPAVAPPALASVADSTPEPAEPTRHPEDYARRAVAYIHGTTMISREDLGEFLIEREGASRLPFLVNRRIIEQACKKHGIEVTQAEIDATVNEEMRRMKCSPREFEAKVLRPNRKTMYEWREDAIWTRLALGKLCRERVKATPEEIEKAYQTYYGERVDGRIILYPREEKATVLKIHAEIQANEDAFNSWARKQPSPTLAATGGKLEHPIGRYATGYEAMEREIFSLRPGQVSGVVETPDGVLLFKCDRRIPADTSIARQTVEPVLEREIVDRKLNREIFKLYNELRTEANPSLFLKDNLKVNLADLDRTTRELLDDTRHLVPPGTGQRASTQP